MITIQECRPEDFPAQDNLFQTSFWGRLKTACGQQAVFFLCEWSSYRFPLLVLLRRLSKNALYAYVPRGPSLHICEADYGLFLEKLSLALQPLLPSECICVRYDLPWRSPFSHGSAYTVPPRREIREMRMNYGTEHSLLRKASMDYLCPDTVLINLELPPEKLLMKMRQTTRNSIRKSYKLDVDFFVRSACFLPQWHALYADTAERKGFFSEKMDYFEKLFYQQKKTLHDDSGKGPPLTAPVPDPEFYLLTAEKKDAMLSGMILGICGKTAYYMFAGSSLEHRDLMPNYGLQWEAMLFSRSKGCTRYDLMGIPPNNDQCHPMSGLYIFKTGLGGDPVRYCGTWDFPYDQSSYEWLRNQDYLSDYSSMT
ncbi:MAG TPA: peptidoglycan bridge formation glycyltransferase FemA/FemB family protein [Treponemataceae bacterium]|nr:peptidoglycan bridge formation glycyltransferase FemA/FemB family protein [Treponemataceae bacterium]